MVDVADQLEGVWAGFGFPGRRVSRCRRQRPCTVEITGFGGCKIIM